MTQQPPFSYLRVAPLDKNGEPILAAGEGARQWNGTWYIVDDQITLQ